MWKQAVQHSSLSRIILYLRLLISLVPDTSNGAEISNTYPYGSEGSRFESQPNRRIVRSQGSRFESQQSQLYEDNWKSSDGLTSTGWTDGRRQRVEEYMSDLHRDWSPEGGEMAGTEQKAGPGGVRTDAVMGFQSPPVRYSNYPATYQNSRCIDIPSNLTLCQNVGYQQMRLPNLLEHSTVPEVLQQASSWVPLLNRRCHPNTQLLLCSLFAPVCLEAIGTSIMPCRSLCEAVKEGCESHMLRFNFPWPDMLRCDKFPPDHELCISMQKPDESERHSENHNNDDTEVEICEPCNQPISMKSFVDAHCTSDFAAKLKLKRFQVEGSNLILPITSASRLKIIKNIYDNSTSTNSLAPSSILLENSASCNCPQLEWTPEVNIASSKSGKQQGSRGEKTKMVGKKGGMFFISGRRVGNKILVTFLQRLDTGEGMKDGGRGNDGGNRGRNQGVSSLAERREAKRTLKDATRALKKNPESCRPKNQQDIYSQTSNKQKPTKRGKERKNDKSKENKNNKDKLNDKNTMRRKNKEKEKNKEKRNREQ